MPREAHVVEARERLARLDDGGSPERPLDVDSASQIEARALSMPCLRCDGPYRLDEHTVEYVGIRPVRMVQVHCGHCGSARVVYFRVTPRLSS